MGTMEQVSFYKDTLSNQVNEVISTLFHCEQLKVTLLQTGFHVEIPVRRRLG